MSPGADLAASLLLAAWAAGTLASGAWMAGRAFASAARRADDVRCVAGAGRRRDEGPDWGAIVETATGGVDVRWAIGRDLPEMLAIEAAGPGRPWDDAEFRAALGRRNCIGLVAEHGGAIVGFAVYELGSSRIRVLKLAVRPDRRRRGVGRRLVAKLAGKLSEGRRNGLVLDIADDNLDAHLFLKSCGFRAVAVDRGRGEERDSYRFVLRHREGAGVGREGGDTC